MKPDRYLLFWMKVLAGLLSGDYEMSAVLCHPGKNGRCVNDHELISVVRPDQIRGLCEEGFAPVFFASPIAFIPKTMDDLDADEVLWMGDIDREGGVICGEALSWLIYGVEIVQY